MRPAHEAPGARARVFLLDNYDSFTYNLAHHLEQLGATVDVELNDAVDPQRILARGYDGIVISPGPGRPEAAGITLDLVRAAAGRVPLLGVCLGHQAIALVHGGRIVRAKRLMHGKASRIRHDGRGVFRGLPNPFLAGRYHSLTADPAAGAGPLRVTALAEDGAIMGLRHPSDPIEGVQFHPESVLTPTGLALLRNFLHRARMWAMGGLPD